MDELIEILHEDGSFSGKSILKSEAHKKGVFHASAHIWILNTEHQMLIQKRAATKDTFPNLWDISVAGHISFGELPLTSALREIEEETGLHLKEHDLIASGTFEKKVRHSKDLIDHELHYIFLCKIPFSIEDLTPQDGEVSAFKLIPLSAFIETTNRANFAPHGKAYFEFVQQSIQKID